MELFGRLRHLVDRWIPAYHEPGDQEAGLVHRYYQFLCSIIAGFFVLFASHSFYLGIHRLAIAQCLVIGVIFLSVAVYRRTRSTTAGANIILGLTAPITLYRVYLLGGMDSPMLFGWPVISMLALMTLPMSWTLLWTGIHMAFALFFYFSEVSGVHYPVQSPASVVANVRIAMICTVQFIVFFSVYLIRRLNTDLRAQLREQSDQVLNVVRTLSHDLSSPLMTLKFWTRDLQKKGLHPDLRPEQLDQTLNTIATRIAEVRAREAEASGKSGTSPNRADDPEKRLAAHIFKFTTTVLAVVFAAFAAYYASVGAYTVAALQLAIAVSSVLGWWLFLKTGSVVWAGNLILCFGVFSGFFRAKMLGGIGSPAFFIWPMIPVFAGTILPLRLAGAWTFIFVMIPVYYDVCERLGVTFAPQVSENASLQIRIVALCVVQVIVVATTYYLKKQNRAFRELIEHQRQRRLDLLRLLAQEVGEPLRQFQKQLKSQPGTPSLAQITRSVNACVDIVNHCEAWVRTIKPGAATEVVNLREVLEEVEFLHHSALKQKQIAWSVDFKDAHLAPLVQADRVCLAYQICNNLISNSIKFTDASGRIRVQVQPGQNHWDLIVEDSGIGIPAPILAKLFDSGYPTTREGTNGEKGTGFGMPIVKMFVERYGGSIAVESRTTETHPQDHGTKISVRLPAA